MIKLGINAGWRLGGGYGKADASLACRRGISPLANCVSRLVSVRAKSFAIALWNAFQARLENRRREQAKSNRVRYAIWGESAQIRFQPESAAKKTGVYRPK